MSVSLFELFQILVTEFNSVLRAAVKILFLLLSMFFTFLWVIVYFIGGGLEVVHTIVRLELQIHVLYQRRGKWSWSFFLSLECCLYQFITLVVNGCWAIVILQNLIEPFVTFNIKFLANSVFLLRSNARTLTWSLSEPFTATTWMAPTKGRKNFNGIFSISLWQFNRTDGTDILDT